MWQFCPANPSYQITRVPQATPGYLQLLPATSSYPQLPDYPGTSSYPQLHNVGLSYATVDNPFCPTTACLCVNTNYRP